MANDCDGDTWLPARVEENGTLNLNRVLDHAPGTSAYAGCQVRSDAEGRALLSLGFSDRLRLWPNGELLHEGQWRWNPAQGSDGRVRPERRQLSALKHE